MQELIFCRVVSRRKRERERIPFFHTGKGNGKSRTNNMGKITNVAEINAESKLVKIAQIFLSLVILAERYSYVQV